MACAGALLANTKKFVKIINTHAHPLTKHVLRTHMDFFSTPVDLRHTWKNKNMSMTASLQKLSDRSCRANGIPAPRTSGAKF